MLSQHLIDYDIDKFYVYVGLYDAYNRNLRFSTKNGRRYAFSFSSWMIEPDWVEIDNTQGLTIHEHNIEQYLQSDCLVLLQQYYKDLKNKVINETIEQEGNT